MSEDKPRSPHPHFVQRSLKLHHLRTVRRLAKSFLDRSWAHSGSCCTFDAAGKVIVTPESCKCDDLVKALRAAIDATDCASVAFDHRSVGASGGDDGLPTCACDTHPAPLRTWGGCGDITCCSSTGIHEGLTFGRGELDEHGYWEIPCSTCARAYEKAHPEDAPCWPFEEQRRPTATDREVIVEAEGDLLQHCTVCNVPSPKLFGLVRNARPIIPVQCAECLWMAMKRTFFDLEAIEEESKTHRQKYEHAARERDELAPLRERMAKGRQRYPNGCTVLSLIDEAGEVAHTVNKYGTAEKAREELLDVANVAMRLYLGEIDTDLIIDGLVQRRTDT